MARKPKIFITGGAGFIGSNLIKKIHAHDPGQQIWVYDNLHPQVHGANAIAPQSTKSLKFIKGDITDIKKLSQAVESARPQIVYHLSAETGTGQSYDEPVRYCNVNVIGTANLVESIRNVESVERIVLAASRSVYGEGAYIDSTGREFVGLTRDSKRMESGDFTVQLPKEAVLPAKPSKCHAGLPVVPSSIYASTKLMQEHIIFQAGEGAPWKAVALRFQNVYGPGQSMGNPYTGVLSFFVNQIISKNAISIFEDGEISRDFVFIDDAVDALIKSGQLEIENGFTVDIGSGKAERILEIARMLAERLGVKNEAFQITGEFRAGDIRHACADISVAETVLGWKPQTSIPNGLNKLAEWAKNNNDHKR